MEQRLQMVGVVCYNKPQSFPPGSRWLNIANVAGYLIAGAIAEAVTGKSWEALMAERLFVPLGMASADFGPPENLETNSQPHGHIGRTPIEPSTIDLVQLGLQLDRLDSSTVRLRIGVNLLPCISPAPEEKVRHFENCILPCEDEPGASENFNHDLSINGGANYALGWWVGGAKLGGRIQSCIIKGYYQYYAHARVYIAPHKDVAVLLATNSNKGGSSGGSSLDAHPTFPGRVRGAAICSPEGRLSRQVHYDSSDGSSG